MKRILGIVIALSLGWDGTRIPPDCAALPPGSIVIP